MKAAFVVIEGLEGAGKSTVINALENFFTDLGHNVICTREPGGTPMAEAIRDCVKHTWENETVTQETELLLMYAARSQLVHNIILPALANNTFVIGDRHDLSSVAYQGGGRQVPLENLQQLKQLTLGDFTPDFTLYLDIEPSVGLARAKGRGALDRIELAGLAFFERARETYLEQVALLDNVAIIDAGNNANKVKEDALYALKSWYYATKGEQ
ncbi:MAG: dTMP kinase [Alphaproteobacteria bacterium]|jgi:dTMP kinase